MTELNQKVYEKAIKFLSMRMHTTGELFAKLRQRKFQEKDIRPVLRYLEEERLLNDEQFGQIFVENMKLYKDWGFYGIKNKLLQRKIDGDLAEQILTEFFSLEDEEKVGERVMAKLKKLGRVDRGKLMKSLERKGFRNEVIFRLVKG